MEQKEYKKYCIACDKLMAIDKYKDHKLKESHKANQVLYEQYKKSIYKKKRPVYFKKAKNNGKANYSEKYCKYCEKDVRNYSAHKRCDKHLKLKLKYKE